MADGLARDPVDPAQAEERGRVHGLGLDRVEVARDDLAAPLEPEPAGHDREELLERPAILQEMIGDGEAVDQAPLHLGPILGGHRLEGHDVVLVVAAPADAPLEVALDTRPGVEDRPEPVALRQRVVRLPLVLEEREPRLLHLGRRPRPAHDRQPRREHPEDADGPQPEHPQPYAAACTFPAATRTSRESSRTR